MDEYEIRQALVRKAVSLLRGPEAACWSDVYDQMHADIASLASRLGKSTAYVLAAIIDDVDAGLDDD